MSSNDGHRESGGRAVGHVTVLSHEAIEALGMKSADVVVDATLGGGGHAKSIAEALGKGGMLIGMDLDKEAVDRTKIALERISKPKIHLLTANFRNISSELAKLNVKRIDKALFDLGWSGYQLSAGRGFSFLKDEPLQMTYSANPGAGTLTVSTIVNEWGEESIADIIFGWGEEKYSRRIAKKIVERRSSAPFKTASELADAISSAVPASYRHGRIHPATRTFQALRIAVNDELGALKEGLAGAWQSLAEGGRIAVITFHSIEDREVKRLFLKWEQNGEGKRITHSPLRASAEEIKTNPRSRSAKLRVIQKTFQNRQ
ncbi:MAG: 16S rRNA (cytosine(1402)-N(4))-methyltransferase RsmH [Candidatus Kaiserbacteria bacterium]|nr:16S rRNA (cytosine(1402)-N(4))-methyltransferase RsmH [Candidatus Kaiserbacteria bacterium]